ncbi:MAG: hypothetical protein ACOX5R_21865 [bacterium]|jgi:hypothetical protein
MLKRAIITFFAIYLLLLIPGSGLALCWGEGHFALESWDGDSCCAEVDNTAPFAYQEEDICECISCWDMVVAFESEGQLLRPQPEWKDQIQAPLIPAEVHNLSQNGIVKAHVIEHPAFPLFNPQYPIRTVQLLI